MRKGPLITLIAVAVLGIGLLAVNMSKQSDDSAPAATSGAPTPSDTSSSEPTATEPGARFPDVQDYVGSANGGRITVSVTVEADQAIAYICDGATVEAWLTGSAIDGTVDLANARGATLTGRLSGTDIDGALELPGEQAIAFTAGPVAPPSGLYVRKTDEGRQSWIVDGTDVVGVSRDARGNTSPAPALPAGAVKVHGSDTDVF